MSWLFSQALVEEYLGDISLDGEQSVQLNGKPIQQAYCAPDKMTKFSRLSRFGMMYKPLTESLGKELLMSYLEDFHAKILVRQERGGVLLEAEVQCGNTWRELLAKYNPDTALWKTAQCSLLEDLEQSLEIWPNWGSMRNGECFRQPMLAQITLGSESGLLEKIWPTPRAKMSGFQVKERVDRKNTNLEEVVAERMKWPTPSVRDYKGGYIGGRIRNGKVSWDTLDVAVQHTDNPNKDGGHLNPMWVEWLMGWPIEWTDLNPLETDKCHFVQQQPGDC
jgi:hypothetical protein